MINNSFSARLWRKFFRFFILPFVNAAFVRKQAVFESIVSHDTNKLFVITVAFNDVELVSLQHRALKKFLRDPFEYFVVDNSNNDERADTIKKFCMEQGLNYARLGYNVGNTQKDAGTAHGMALNWAYRNIVMRFKAPVFGFWDYDLFPTKPVNVAERMAASEGWGIAIKMKPYLTPWHYPAYFWVGLLFFQTKRFKSKMQNFLPNFGVDTGGRIPLDGKIIAAIPDLIDFYASPMVEIAPGVRVRQCGDFIHFEGSSGGGAPAQALDIKKQWVEQLIQSS